MQQAVRWTYLRVANVLLQIDSDFRACCVCTFGAGLLSHQHALELLVNHDYKTTHKQVNKQITSAWEIAQSLKSLLCKRDNLNFICQSQLKSKKPDEV